MKVATPSVVQTKSLKESDGVVVKGRIAQHHQRPDLSNRVRGRGLSPVENNGIAKSYVSSNNMHHKGGSDLIHTDLSGQFVLVRTRRGEWIEGSVESTKTAIGGLDPPRWAILLENGKYITGGREEVSRWLNSWCRPYLYFCTPTQTQSASAQHGDGKNNTVAGKDGEDALNGSYPEDSESDSENDAEVSTNQQKPHLRTELVACPRCSHSFCNREERLSPFSPTTRTILKCGHSITPAGRRYCCECGGYYRPTTPITATRRRETTRVESSPNSVE